MPDRWGAIPSPQPRAVRVRKSHQAETALCASIYQSYSGLGPLWIHQEILSAVHHVAEVALHKIVSSILCHEAEVTE
jgi:hypothetical protein